MDYNAKTSAEYVKEIAENNNKQAKLQEKILKQAVADALKNDSAKRFFQFLKDISLWDKNELNVNPDILAYQKGRRDVWLIVRNYLPKDILANIEIHNKYAIEEKKGEEQNA